MFNLFALTDDPATRRLRFSLSNEVQRDLTELLQQQESSFNSNGHDEIPFDGKYKPDFGEVLTIGEFDDIDELADAVAHPLSVPEVAPIPEAFNTIKALFSGYVGQDGLPVVLLQHFDKKRVISTNGLSIFHSSNVYKKIEGIGLTIDSKLTAIIRAGVLKFQSFHLLRQIFDVSAYYKEATDGDIQQFASLPCVHVTNATNLVAVSDTWVRRKLWLISQSQILQKVPVCDIKAVAAEFSIQLQTTISEGTEKILIPETKKDLKTILRFLDEDYYKSPLLQNCYLTNSKRPV
ncbi:MAG: Kiwa anti-phage protein KwaB-like domain-containing protein [Pseudomonadota bacterium]